MADGEFHATASSLARVVGLAKLDRWRRMPVESGRKFMFTRRGNNRTSRCSLPVSPTLIEEPTTSSVFRGGKGPGTRFRGRRAVSDEEAPSVGRKIVWSGRFMAKKKSVLKGLLSISELEEEHPARKIVDKRKLPNSSLRDIYLCESFYKFTNTLIPNKFPSLDGDHPRLLIPFRDEQGEIFAYQGRAFGIETPKYITI